MFNPKLWAVLQERHRDLKERGSSGSSEQATDSPRSAARAFHVLPVLLKNDLWKVLLQDLIKNKVISKLLVYLVILVGAPIRGVTVGLISTCQVTALKRKTTSRYSCQYVRGGRFLHKLSLYDCWQWNGRLRMYFEARLWIRSILQTSSIDWGAHTCVPYPSWHLSR